MILLTVICVGMIVPCPPALAQKKSHLPPLSKQELNHALLAAVEEDSEEKALAALNRGADVNARDQYGRTALMRARENMARLLLKRGANVHLRDKYGATALFHASSEKIELLLEHGADVNAKESTQNQTLLAMGKTEAGERTKVQPKIVFS
jgi:ankyrin repeat protein